MNTANTSVTVQAGRLYALWEGGSATELDPITLGTLGPHAWAPELAGVPFSAHPKREPDGTLWNFGTFAGKLVLYQIGADGRLQRSQLLPLPGAPMLHDFVLTERFIVLLLPPLSLDMAALAQRSLQFCRLPCASTPSRPRAHSSSTRRRCSRAARLSCRRS
jgi:all-trans-8'-apo-beta-carotenal 15,15'-oxygenase